MELTLLSPLTVTLFLLLVAGCASDRVVIASAEEDSSRSIYVVRHGWHTGIAVRAAEVPREAWPFREEFPGAQYLELGWGDRDFYRAKDAGLLLALKAILWPTPGVLHVVGFEGTVEWYFSGQELVQVRISEHGFAGLVRYVRDDLELNSRGEPIALGPGLYGRSMFYASRESFHLFKTCNVWTARALRAAGVPVAPSMSLTSEGLLAQIRAVRQEP